jgi:glycosyltransferase involved in cell wall biosynthesis
MSDIKTPILSITISSYNHGKYIAQTIDSILKQSFTDFELIIVDDASSDNSLKIIKSFSDPRIKLIALEKNNGVCNSCNKAISIAVGKYFKGFASDDIMMPGALAKKIQFLEQNQEYDAVFSAMQVIDENGKILKKKTKRFKRFFTDKNRSKEEWLNHFFNKGNCLAAPTAMVRTELLRKVGGFDQRFAQAHDFDAWVKCCLYGKNIYVFEDEMVQYRRVSNNQNLSSNTAKMRKRLLFDNEKVLERFLVINEVEQLVKIFPDLNSIKEKLDNSLIPFFLAQQALKVTGTLYHKQFALNVIFKELGNSEIANKLKERFNFIVNKDFYEIVVKSPIGVLFEEKDYSICNRIAKEVKKLFKKIIPTIS